MFSTLNSLESLLETVSPLHMQELVADTSHGFEDFEIVVVGMDGESSEETEEHCY